MELDASKIFLHENGQHEEVDLTEIILKDNPPQEGEEKKEEKGEVEEEEESEEDSEEYQTSKEVNE